MDPTALVEWLTKLGPWAVAGILVVWLSLERKERVAAQQDASKVRDELKSELKAGGGALAELGESTRSTLRELTDSVKKIGGP
jgi:hypothetical protein